MLPTWSFKTRWKRLCHFYPVYLFLLPAVFHSLPPYFLHERAVGQEKFCPFTDLIRCLLCRSRKSDLPVTFFEPTRNESGFEVDPVTVH